MRRIGVLMGFAEMPEAQANVAAFRDGLQKLGVDGGPQHPDRHALGNTRRRGIDAAS